MTQLRPAVHRTILVVDVEHYGDLARTNAHQLLVRAGMYRALERAFDAAGIPWTDCRREDRGDGVFVLAAASIPKVRFVEALPEALAGELREHNRGHPVEARIRLRMALHAGEVRFDDHGLASPAVIHAFRLVDAAPLKAALLGSSGELAVMASSWFFDEVIRHSPHSHADAYRKVAAQVKETSATGWIRLVDRPDQPRVDRRGAPDPVTRAAPDSLSQQAFYAVVEALESIPCLSTESDRTFVIAQLRPAIAGAVRYYSQRRLHVTSILRTCADYDGGVDELVTVISKIEQDGSLPVRRLVDLLGGANL